MPSTQSITTSHAFHTVHHHIICLPHSPSPHHMPSTQSITTSHSFHIVHHHITCLPHSPSPHHMPSTQSITTSHAFHTVHHHITCLPHSPSPHHMPSTQSITITTCLAHSPSQVPGAFNTIPPSKTVLCNLYHTMGVHATPGHPSGHCAGGHKGLRTSSTDTTYTTV